MPIFDPPIPATDYDMPVYVGLTPNQILSVVGALRRCDDDWLDEEGFKETLRDSLQSAFERLDEHAEELWGPDWPELTTRADVLEEERMEQEDDSYRWRDDFDQGEDA